MDVLMVSAELAPYVRASDAADAVPSLAKALRQLGHRVTIALPRYRAIESEGLMVARRLTPLSVSGGEVTLFDGQLPSGVELVLFEAAGIDFDAPAYGVDSTADVARFAWLARAAAALSHKRREQGAAFHVVHGHDWPGGLVACFLEAGVAPVVLTIHDARRAGFAERAALASLSPGLELGERPSALEVAMRRAALVSTVSPSYARSLAEQGAGGLPASAFAVAGEGPIGIESGLDYAAYNPATDSVLEARYDAEDPWGKARTKGAMLRKLRLDLDIERPLAVFVAPLTEESGADILLDALPRLLKNDVAVAVAGRGSEFAPRFRALAEERPDVVALVEADDDDLVRRLHAAADLAFVIPRHSPGAFRAQLAQRYGALPVARATGGIADAVVDCDSELETGTGFLFAEPDATSLLGAGERALSAYASEADWARLRRRAMRLDLGWDRPARRYAQLYRRAAEQPT